MAHTNTSDGPSLHESGPENSSRRAEAKRKGRAERMWKPVKLHLTEKYQYITRNFILIFLHYLFTWTVMPAIYLVLWIRWGFRVHGRANMRKVRGRSAITVSNHIHDVDSLMVTAPLWPKMPYIVARKHNLEVFLLGTFDRIMRAVPLPTDMTNFRYFSRAMNDLLSTTTNRLHLFPEGEIQPYARELREFGNGAFHFAAVNNTPIVPMVFVVPKPEHLELIVGDPIEPSEVPGITEDMKASRRTRILRDCTKQRMRDMLSTYYAARCGTERNK